MARKHTAGDRWGVIAVNQTTGKKTAVQIGYWETTTWPYAKQAQQNADANNQHEIEYPSSTKTHYEIRYIGNWKTGIYPDNSDVEGQGFAGWRSWIV